MATTQQSSDQLLEPDREYDLVQDLKTAFNTAVKSLDYADTLQDSDGNYWMTVPEIMDYMEIEDTAYHNMQEVDETAKVVAMEHPAITRIDDIDRTKDEFYERGGDEWRTGRSYWNHRNDRTDDILAAPETQAARMQHFQVKSENTDEMLE